MRTWILFWLVLVAPISTLAIESLQKVELGEDGFMLVDVSLNNDTVVRSLDMYLVNGKKLIAIEPMLDALKVRYQLSDTRLIIWREQQSFELDLERTKALISSDSRFVWASDDFYVFVELGIFEEIFTTKIEYKPRQLKLILTTPRAQALFPLQLIAQQNKRRELERLSTVSSRKLSAQSVPITIEDQYRLFTIPHGRINVAAEQSNEGSGFNSSFQLTSDLLYHSAELTLTDSKNSDLAARLQLSRYKTSPDNYILGLYDHYQFGDISSRSNNLTTGTNAGIGVTFERRSENFRDSNQFITLKQTAPPGWEAELFRNQIFLQSTTIPDDGLLVFDDVEVTYGNNKYIIKLYGPFGEKEVIIKSYDLTQNALSKGQSAHSIYALDRNHRLINDQNDLDYSITDFGGTFDYGITDNWQMGVGYAGLVGDQQLFSLSNSVSLPGMLLENDVSVDQEGNYAQLTTLQGGAFGEDRYTINFESGNNFTSDQLSLQGDSYQLDASYFLNTKFVGTTFGTKYLKDDFKEQYVVSNRMSGSVGGLLLRHNLSYVNNKSFVGGKLVTNNILGSLGVSGTLPFDIRVSANMNYNPEDDDIILDSSSFILQKNIEDPWNTRHYLTFNYLPLAQTNRDRWRLSHRASWRTGKFNLTLASEYGDNDKWGIQLGLQFFLGYDYRNRQVTLSQRLLPNTASLDIHTYLDRQINGLPDPLDYDLEGVNFTGNSQWNDNKTGSGGRVVLPGVYPNTLFRFGANWKEGSSTINNDYVVFTHPGAYINVNMPFILSTELIGFVLRTNNGQEVALQNAMVELYADEKLLESKETDIDGYFEFLGLKPGQYRVEVAEDTLVSKGYTSNIIGFDVTTGGNGGYAELPAIKLQRLGENGVRDEEKITGFGLNTDNTEPVVWDNDEKERRNYFTLPTKNKVEAAHSLSVESVEVLEASLSNTKPTKILSDELEGNLGVSEPSRNSLPSIKFGAPKQPSQSNAEGTTDISPSIQLGSVNSSNTILNQTQAFEVQLGIYRDLGNAQELVERLASIDLPKSDFRFVEEISNNMFRVVYGQFSNRNEGLEFANQHFTNGETFFVRPSSVRVSTPVNEIEVVLNNAWVIQLYASENDIKQGLITQRFSRLDGLYVGQKGSANGRMYCLISRGFSTEGAAQTALIQSGYEGWVVNRNVFQNVKEVQ